MHYRIAMQVDPASTWRWQSTALGSLNALLQWLRFYSAIPRERLRVFSSSSREDLDEQLLRENCGLASTSLPVTHFLAETRGAPHVDTRLVAAQSSGENGKGPPATNESCSRPLGDNPLDRRRDELERGQGGDHDLPYRFSLPTSTRERLAWATLLARVQHGDLQSEVAGAGAVEHDFSDVHAASRLLAPYLTPTVRSLSSISQA